jgi:hypothetical protein
VSRKDTKLSATDDAGQLKSPVHDAIEAIVTTPSAPVHVVVIVIFAPSTSFKLPPDADRVTVCDVPSLEFVIVWSPVFVFVADPVPVATCSHPAFFLP